MIDREILINCGIELKTDNGKSHFTGGDVKARVRVTLDKSLTDGVYLTIFAYPGNAQFDTDASVNKRLGGVKAFDGTDIEIGFSRNALPLAPGYRIVACLNVPVAEDFYLPVVSNAIDVLDADGKGIPQYVWPYISIVETDIQAGADYAHLNFVADERLLSSENVTVSYCVYAYPASDKFDLEEPYMISLVSKTNVKETFENRRIPFAEKVKSGYRVRAIAYWSQCPEEFVPKGNDYEFGQPDNSVKVTDECH